MLLFGKRTTLDTYTHVLDSQKQEKMKVMEEFFTLPSMPQVQSYAIAVTPMPSSFLLNPVDFEDMSIEANDLQYGIQCLQTTIAQKLATMYPAYADTCERDRFAAG